MQAVGTAKAQRMGENGHARFLHARTRSWPPQFNSIHEKGGAECTPDPFHGLHSTLTTISRSDNGCY
jgi:hypothetical protein